MSKLFTDTIGQYGALSAPAGAITPLGVDSINGALRDLTASALEPGLSRAERLTRMERAAQAAAAAQDWAAALDPYRDGRHSELRDMLEVVGTPGRPGITDGDAADRLSAARAAELYRYQARAGVDLAGLQVSSVARLQPWPSQQTPLVDVIATPLAQRPWGPDIEVSEPWDTMPEAGINDGDQSGELKLGPGGPRTIPLTTSHYSTEISRNIIDLMPDTLTEFDSAVRTIVTVGLERRMVASLAAGAPTAATFAEAEAAVGAGMWSADVILCAGSQAPAVRRAYAAELPNPGNWPIILPTVGLEAGNALVIATGGIHADATPVSWVIADAPRTLGSREVGAYRSGSAFVRVASTVQKVVVE